MRVGRQSAGEVVVDDADVRLVDARGCVDVHHSPGTHRVGDDLADRRLQLDVI